MHRSPSDKLMPLASYPTLHVTQRKQLASYEANISGRSRTHMPGWQLRRAGAPQGQLDIPSRYGVRSGRRSDCCSACYFPDWICGHSGPCAGAPDAASGYVCPADDGTRVALMSQFRPRAAGRFNRQDEQFAEVRPLAAAETIAAVGRSAPLVNARRHKDARRSRVRHAVGS